MKVKLKMKLKIEITIKIKLKLTLTFKLKKVIHQSIHQCGGSGGTLIYRLVGVFSDLSIY